LSLASEQQRFADESGHARSIQEWSSPDSIVAHRHDIADFFNSLLEDLERATHVIQQFFSPRQIEIVVRLNDDASPPPRFRFPITWRGGLSTRLSSGETLEVGFVSPIEFADFYSKMGLRLLQKNIRAGLMGETAPNRSLRRAFLDIADGKANPEEFAFRHNGISVEVSDLIHSDNGTIELVEPRIINGAQTVVMLSRLLDATKGSALSSEQRKQLSRARVIGRVIYKCSESFVTEVTISNNKQNPVDPWNLRACDRYQIDLQQRFKEPPIGLHYDRLQNSYVAKGQEEWEEEGVKAGRVIEIRKLAMALAATQGEIDRMSRMPDVFEQETLYRNTFQAKYVEEGFDLRAVVLSYKIQYCLRPLMEEIWEKGKLYEFVWRARNLVWALTIQGLLNDSNLRDHLENYGTDLRAGDDFRERLRKIARSRLVPVLRDAVKLPSYAEQLKHEKFSFLKTNAFYRSCMDIAGDKFNWSRKRL